MACIGRGSGVACIGRVRRVAYYEGGSPGAIADAHHRTVGVLLEYFGPFFGGVREGGALCERDLLVGGELTLL